MFSNHTHVFGVRGVGQSCLRIMNINNINNNINNNNNNNNNSIINEDSVTTKDYNFKHRIENRK